MISDKVRFNAIFHNNKICGNLYFVNISRNYSTEIKMGKYVSITKDFEENNCGYEHLEKQIKKVIFSGISSVK